ncbi:MAG: hypothetical protein ACKPKB_23235 [Dolichospermum sp.]
MNLRRAPPNTPNTPKPDARNVGSRQFILSQSDFLTFSALGKLKLKPFLEEFMFQKNMAGNIVTYSSPSETCNLSVTRNITTYQVFLIYSFAFKLIGGKFYQLKKLIAQRKLTESLEVLEKSGISGDFALFIIQNIQMEVA